ncbi:MAG: viperin family antiviral radical SAM protein [Candidatus Helarchaeota archaeon]
MNLIKNNGDSKFAMSSTFQSQNSLFHTISKFGDKKPIAINFHVWPKCNYKCKFCFAQFKDYRCILSKEQSLRLITQIREWGIEKINFAGGEPTLCPYLSELLQYSKELGITTSIISNGTGISQDFLMKNSEALDWLGLSIDSGNEATQLLLGRGNGNHVSLIIRKVEMVKKFDIHLKINTVVTALNYREDMNWLIERFRPDRWKVFQVLLIENQNKLRSQDLLITEDQFVEFIKRHEGNDPIVESNRLMHNSYIMVDPCGRFYQNTGYTYSYSRSILKVGVETAFRDIRWDSETFIQRGGFYRW